MKRETRKSKTFEIIAKAVPREKFIPFSAYIKETEISHKHLTPQLKKLEKNIENPKLLEVKK